MSSMIFHILVNEVDHIWTVKLKQSDLHCELEDGARLNEYKAESEMKAKLWWDRTILIVLV
jgi:hypothetical protein